MSDLRVEMLATEALTPAHRRAVIEVCKAAHDEDDFENLFTYIPSGGRHFLGYLGTELVSHAVATTRWLQPEGLGLLRTAWLDAVSTLPAEQGQGWGSAVLGTLAAAIEDYEIGGLQTDRIGFYQRLGWELWPGPLFGRVAAELVATPEQRGVMVLRLPSTPPLDLTAPLSIEAQSNRIWS